MKLYCTYTCEKNSEALLACTFVKKYTCIITEATIKSRNFIKKIIGNHVSDQFNNDCVDTILFDGKSVEYFPRGLEKIFPSLKTVAIRKCGLKSLSREDLNGLENIECLDLSYNALHSLPTNLFTGMNKLTSISFYGNDVEYISSKIFYPIEKNLEYELLREPQNKLLLPETCLSL